MHRILCLAPLTPYLVLASRGDGLDADDLLLLSKTRDVLSPVAPNSSIVRDTLQTCVNMLNGFSDSSSTWQALDSPGRLTLLESPDESAWVNS